MKMRTVLIVDDEKEFLESLAAGLEAYNDIFTVVMATNGRQAVDILNARKVDLVVTDLLMPEMDGFELLSHMKFNFPDIPVIVLSAYTSGEYRKSLSKMGLPRWIEKPVDFDLLARCVLSYFESDHEQGEVEGVTVSSIIQLMEMEEKTCFMQIASDSGKKGYCYFSKGVLFDAWCDELKGEKAALEMISWNNARIGFKAVSPSKIPRRIKKSAMSLIMEEALRRDESGVEGSSGFPEEKNKSQSRVSRGKGPFTRSGDVAIIGGISTTGRD